MSKVMRDRDMKLDEPVAPILAIVHRKRIVFKSLYTAIYQLDNATLSERIVKLGFWRVNSTSE